MLGLNHVHVMTMSYLAIVMTMICHDNDVILSNSTHIHNNNNKNWCLYFSNACTCGFLCMLCNVPSDIIQLYRYASASLITLDYITPDLNWPGSS